MLVQQLQEYQMAALQNAVIKEIKNEGYSARIPGFNGLIVFGNTEKEVMSELASALEGWIELSLARGDGLPSVRAKKFIHASTAL
jgi:predicted RNase H-like HicB family nuclease